MWCIPIGNVIITLRPWLKKCQIKAVGIEFDHLPLERLNKLKAVLPNVEFVDISVACMKVRMIKSAEEIAHIKTERGSL